MSTATIPPSIDDRRRRQETAVPRVPPHNLQAEESLLGAMLLSREAIVAAVEVQLSADDFYKPAHGHIFDAITSLYAQGEPADPVTVAEALTRAGVLEVIGGPAILISLQAGTPSIGNAGTYAAIVEEHSGLRRLIALGNDLAELGYDAPADVSSRLADAERRLARLRSTGSQCSELGIRWAGEVSAAVDAMPEPQWLFEGVWPADAYGVTAADIKAGKTWANCDAMVSKATGTPWMGVFACPRPGPVLAFLGEGGDRKMVRRLRAVCEARGAVLEELPIRLCFRVPHLTNDAHIELIRSELVAHRAELVIIDPLYLAAQGARGSDLYEMGATLERVQLLAQECGAALLVTTHINKTGEGKGAKRITGVGPGAWGRVLATASVEKRHTEPSGATVVTLAWEFIGDEIADADLRIRRRVWADDPTALTSPLHYTVEQLEAIDPAPDSGDMSPATRRVLRVIEAATSAVTVQEIGDELARDTTGMPLKKRTIQDSLSKLAKAGLAESEQSPGGAYVWRAQCDGRGAEDAA